MNLTTISDEHAGHVIAKLQCAAATAYDDARALYTTANECALCECPEPGATFDDARFAQINAALVSECARMLYDLWTMELAELRALATSPR